MTNTPLSRAIRHAMLTSSFVSAALVTGTVSAQDSEPAASTPTTLDRIEVTGSRIKRTDIETSQPVFSLSRDEIAAQGLTSIGDVIQNLTSNGTALNTTFNNGGNGETRVSLRNLGSNRTLVLVNGRRWIGGTGLGGAVDLNTIPTASVERIEVLKDGASTIYGSDAIAGVVNVILRQNYDGAEANAYLGAFDKGDGNREAFDFTVGSVGERWAAMLGVGYVKEEPVMAGDRAISAEPVAGTGNAFGSTTSPNGRFALCNGTINPITGACSVAQTKPDGTGGTFTYNPGTTADAWRTFLLPDDVYNFAPENYLLTPQERRSLFAAGSVDITDNLRFKLTTTFNERISEQLLAAMPIVLGTGPGAGVQSRTVSISPDSIFNPFGVPISRIQRRAVETGGRSFNQDVQTFAFNGGFEGTFDIADKPFDWEAGYFWGRNQSNNVTDGLLSVPALRSALGPSMLDGAGNPVCVSTPGNLATVITGCVPLNLLGGVGSITPEMLEFVTFVAHDQFEYKQKTYYANVGGDLFDLPGGPFAFSFGLEHRTESGFDSPDALINSGNTTGNARKATAGSYSLDEAYLELAIPVLKDVPGAQLLDFSVATRYSDYSNFGDTLNSKFGFRWKPIDDLLIRGNWSEGFRAPSIGELFTGVGDSFPSIADPCNLARFPNLSPEAQARCVAQGVPVGGYDQGNPQIRISVGGNVNLQPETATSTTLGFVYSPSWLQGFDVTFDWWKIDLDDAITVIPGQSIVDNCIVENISAFCGIYSRSPGGAIDTLLATTVNIGGSKVEGYDLTLGYKLPENAWGKLSFTWDTTYLAKFENDLDGDGKFGEVSEGGNLAGEYQQNNNNWRIRSNLAARWEKGDWGATWNVRYYSHQDEACQSFVDYGYSFLCSDPDREVQDESGATIASAENHIGGTTYHDASVYWSAPWNAKITIGVNNLFDKDPPRSVRAAANSFDPQYDVPGSFFYMRYSQKF